MIVFLLGTFNKSSDSGADMPTEEEYVYVARE